MLPASTAWRRKACCCRHGDQEHEGSKHQTWRLIACLTCHSPEAQPALDSRPQAPEAGDERAENESQVSISAHSLDSCVGLAPHLTREWAIQPSGWGSIRPSPRVLKRFSGFEDDSCRASVLIFWRVTVRFKALVLQVALPCL